MFQHNSRMGSRILQHFLNFLHFSFILSCFCSFMSWVISLHSLSFSWDILSQSIVYMAFCKFSQSLPELQLYFGLFCFILENKIMGSFLSQTIRRIASLFYSIQREFELSYFHANLFFLSLLGSQNFLSLSKKLLPLPFALLCLSVSCQVDVRKSYLNIYFLVFPSQFQKILSTLYS